MAVDLNLQNFDSRQYEWNDLTVVIGGKVIAGIIAMSYNSKQDKTPIYGKGNQPIAIQKGNISYDGSLTLLQSEFEAIVRSGGKNGILGVTCNIVCSYGNPSNGDMVKNDILKCVEFTEEPRSLNQGDTNMEITLPFVFLRLDRNK